MKYKYALGINDLSQKIQSSVRMGESPFRLTWRVARKDMLYGGIADNKVWLIKTMTLKNGIPQRVFRGKLYEDDGYTVIDGRFCFQRYEIIYGIVIAAILTAVFLSGFNAPVGLGEIIPPILLFSFFGLLIWAISWLFYRKEERYVKAFLEGLGEEQTSTYG